jgi:branched-chain amino acid transport system ATP-binding protein
VLKVRNLDVSYGPLAVLRHVTLHVSPGEIVTLIGANGAGKTTLLRTVAGLVPARGGSVDFRGGEIRGVPPDRIVAAGCSLVPEGRQVFASMPVRENLLLGGYVQVRRAGRREGRRDLERIYDLFPVLRQRERQLAGTLSGGEQQMLAIGRALMARPALMMLDEPSMGLAPLVVRDIFAIVQRIRDEGTTVLLVEQNARSALRLAQRGYVLENGRVVLQGTSEELLANRDVQRAYLGSEVEGEPAAGRKGERR